MENRSTAKHFFTGFIAGGVLAGVTALLFAPKSGREFRKDIDKKRKVLINEAEEYWETAKTKTAGIITDSKRKAEEIISDAKGKASSIFGQGRDFVTGEAGKVKDAVKARVDTYREERKISKH